MNYKMHLLHSHLDDFPDNNSDKSDEQAERFHQHFKPWVRRYASQEIGKILPNYVYNLILEMERNTRIAKGKTYFKRKISHSDKNIKRVRNSN